MNNKGKAKNRVVFENEQYRITLIPLNYAIEVKIMVDGTKLHPRQKLLPEQLYSPLDRSLAYARETAEYHINKRIKQI